MSNVNSDWSFKDPNQPVKLKKNGVKNRNKKKKRKAKKYGLSVSAEFYKSDEWRKIRYRVLRKYSAECMCCGQSKKLNGITVHVDHIKPRSKYPALALTFDNLQILCEKCNMGKGNTDCIDWRPPEIDEELKILMAANKAI